MQEITGDLYGNRVAIAVGDGPLLKNSAALAYGIINAFSS